MTTGTRGTRCWPVPLVIGVLAFGMVLDFRILDPTHLAWIGLGDPATNYLGWLFYRSSAWSIPLGLNPMYGLELGNSIVYSDSNPLLAGFFKGFDSYLPRPFQYFGVWLLTCFVLQAWFAWLLLGLASDSTAIRALGAAFFAMSPPMLWRLHEKVGHFNLVGHFFVLAALYMMLRPESRGRSVRWACLLVGVALVHAYLLFMVAVLWLADAAARTSRQQMTSRECTLELFAMGSLIGLACWQAGYFVVGRGLSGGGYGDLSANLLALFDPGRPDYGLWSAFLPDIGGDGLNHEGFNFLGLGMILLLPLAVVVAVREPRRIVEAMKSRGPLALGVLGLALFSVSHRVGIGGYTLEVPMLDAAVRVANVFRASGRMLWPFYYVVVLSILFLIIAGFSRLKAILMLGVALAVQVGDTYSGWSGIHRAMTVPPSEQLVVGLDSPFWRDASGQYRTVRSIPAGPVPRYVQIASYAGNHGMATDAAYLARYSVSGKAQSERLAGETLRSMRFDRQTLYVLDSSAACSVVERIDRSTDLLARVDELYVLAPGWKECRSCLPLGSLPSVAEFVPGSSAVAIECDKTPR